LYNNSQSVRGDLQILSDRFNVDDSRRGRSKRQIELVLVPIVYTAQLLDDTNSVESVTQRIQDAVATGAVVLGEIIAFSAVGMHIICIGLV